LTSIAAIAERQFKADRTSDIAMLVVRSVIVMGDNKCRSLGNAEFATAMF
jgi:hypothetical protein